jgi:hypothetical protein
LIIVGLLNFCQPHLLDTTVVCAIYYQDKRPLGTTPHSRDCYVVEWTVDMMFEWNPCPIIMIVDIAYLVIGPQGVLGLVATLTKVPA